MQAEHLWRTSKAICIKGGLGGKGGLKVNEKDWLFHMFLSCWLACDLGQASQRCMVLRAPIHVGQNWAHLTVLLPVTLLSLYAKWVFYKTLVEWWDRHSKLLSLMLSSGLKGGRVSVSLAERHSSVVLACLSAALVRRCHVSVSLQWWANPWPPRRLLCSSFGVMGWRYERSSC